MTICILRHKKTSNVTVMSKRFNSHKTQQRGQDEQPNIGINESANSTAQYIYTHVQRGLGRHAVCS